MRDFLKTEDLYVYTVNAFPYGPFKGRRVMEDVYEPDWSTDDRVRYTCDVADVLADIVEDHIYPTIQSAPLAFRPKVTGASDVDALTHNLFRVVAHLIELERTTGTRVKLALEPEPFCFLETTEETVEYFNNHVYSVAGTRALVKMTGQPASEVFGLIRRHLGVVFDICHQSVAFEDITESLAVLEAASIPVFKLQAAAALRIPTVDARVVSELEAFTNTIYLSQTTELRDGVNDQVPQSDRCDRRLEIVARR